MASYRITVRANKTANRPRAKWVVDIAHPNGKRERRFFPTKQSAEAEAQAKKIEIQNIGVRALELPLRVKAQALHAQEALEPYGASILPAAPDTSSTNRHSIFPRGPGRAFCPGQLPERRFGERAGPLTPISSRRFLFFPRVRWGCRIVAP